MMLFEWDESEAARNVAKHGVPFEYAMRVFLDARRLASEDTRCDYGEERWLTLGKIEARLFAVVHTRRGKVTRVISAPESERT